MSIFDAISSGDAAGVAELIRNDPSSAAERTPEGVSCVSFAMYHGKREIAHLIASERADLDIHEACAVGNEHRVRALLYGHPGLARELSPDGFAPVALAAYFGHPAIVQALIDGGADVNAQAKNPMKVAAIHAAVSARNLQCVEILLRHGADPNLKQQQDLTPLQAAQHNHDEPIIKALKAHGAH